MNASIGVSASPPLTPALESNLIIEATNEGLAVRESGLLPRPQLAQSRSNPFGSAAHPVDSLDVVFVSSFPPRECGIATFTSDTREAIMRANPFGKAQVVAMNEPGDVHAYPMAVAWEIERDVPESYDSAAAFLNETEPQVVNLQHEYGLFGGERGSLVFRLLDRLNAPVVLTLHTVLPDPDPVLLEVTRGLVDRAAATVVLAGSAIDILAEHYGAPREKLRFIPHGVPDVPFHSQAAAKKALGLQGRTVLSTCGLMNPDKGIQFAIDAVSRLVADFPDLLYMVIGETHPGVRAHSGEQYREQLQEQVLRLGLQDHVRFENRYLSGSELVRHLVASDVYVVPYLNLNQIVSGTLAYAIGCGKAIVSTSSVYAREMLSDDLGRLVPSRDASAIAQAVAGILRDPSVRATMELRAYELGRSMIWPAVAGGYLDTFRSAIAGQAPPARTFVEQLGYGLGATTRSAQLDGSETVGTSGLV